MRPGNRYHYTAQGGILRYRFVTPGTADRTVKVAEGATAPLTGVCHDINLADGERGDIVRDAMPEIEYGGTVTRGDLLTSDAEGRAIAVVDPAAGATVYYGAIAEVSGVLGDICPTFLATGKLIGPAV